MKIACGNLRQHHPASLAPQDGLKVLVMIKIKPNVQQLKLVGPCLQSELQM